MSYGTILLVLLMPLVCSAQSWQQRYYEALAIASEGGVSATGGTVTNYAGYRAHIFTNSGTFTVTAGGSVDMLIVAGGGGGPGGFSGSYYGAGGAGGQVLVFATNIISGNVIDIGVGLGGTAGAANNTNVWPTAGSNSWFGGSIARGGFTVKTLSQQFGASNIVYRGGTYPGGYDTGGGAGGGGTGVLYRGGAAVSNDYSGVLVGYAGGGSGVSGHTSIFPGPNGGYGSTPAPANKGGGGGAGVNTPSAGGSGIVIIRYQRAQ